MKTDFVKHYKHAVAQCESDLKRNARILSFVKALEKNRPLDKRQQETARNVLNEYSVSHKIINEILK